MRRTIRQSAIDALKILAEYGRTHKVSVTLQNHDTGMMPAPAAPPPATPPAAAGAAGAAAGQGRGRVGGQPPAPPPTWQVLADVIKAAGVAVTPDTSAFPNDTERAAGLKALYPLSDGNSDVHASNLAAAIKIAKDAGYKGMYSIVTDTTSGADPYAATKAILDELIKLL